MKKIILSTFVFSTLLTLQVQATTEGNYIGLDLGNTEAVFSVTDGNLGVSLKDDGTSGTLKLGHQYTDGGRVYAAVQYINAQDANFMLYGLGYDYLFGDAPLKPFIGGYVGYGQFQTDRTAPIDLDLSGVIYGGQAGVNVQINEKLEVEGGYRYLKSNMSDSVSTATVDIDTIKNWFIGFNYKF